MIDAMDTGALPGTIVRLLGSDICNDEVPLSLHEVGLVDALYMARRLRCEPEEVVVFGVQPARLELGLELSEAVEHAIPEVVRRVVEELTAEDP